MIAYAICESAAQPTIDVAPYVEDETPAKQLVLPPTAHQRSDYMPTDDLNYTATDVHDASIENMHEYKYGGYATSTQLGWVQHAEMQNIHQYAFGGYSMSYLYNWNPQQFFACQKSFPVGHGDGSRDCDGGGMDSGADKSH